VAFATGASARTDRVDYYPGDIVVITGSGWARRSGRLFLGDRFPQPKHLLRGSPAEGNLPFVEELDRLGRAPH
jgi:hypothetical protein